MKIVQGDMVVKILRGIGALAGVAALTVSGPVSHADGEPITPAAQAVTALHLMESGRYGEAIPAIQALADLAPNDTFSYQMRGTVELYLGSLNAARRDFGTAAELLPTSGVTLYGQGLTQVWTRHWDDAEVTLALAQQTTGISSTQMDDLTTARAYVRYLRGDLDGARSLAAAPAADGDSVRLELQALIAAHTQPLEGAARLTEFLETASGVPRVREDEGLRPLFDPAVCLEPAVTEPTLRQMFLASLRDNQALPGRRSQSAHGLSGAVTLKAPANLGSLVAAVTFTIDGQLASMVNMPPYEHVWHTEEGVNGPHSIRIDALDAGGNILSTTTSRRVVSNSRPGAPNAGLAGDPQLEARVWNLLRLRPARKVAEWALGGLLAAQGDIPGAQSHRVTAAALDADYKDGRRVARAIFGASGKASLVSDPGTPRGLWVGSASRKQVALTFDDGPNTDKTPTLLDALDKAGVPATFFVVGSRAEVAPDLIHRMALRGDDVEDHSYTHPNMAQTAAPIAESEILRTSVVIRALTGKRPRFFRPPGGQRNPIVYRLARDYGQTVALWTIDALNYEEAGSATGLIDFIMKHMRPGAIVLMHNGMDSTAKAVPGLVAALHAKGYQIVTLSQMTAGTPAVKAASMAKE